MIRYAYDIECFKNLFMVTFVNVDDENDKHSFYAGLGVEDHTPLFNFLKNEEGLTLIGYNNQSYDDAMLRFFMTYRGKKLVEQLYLLSGKLIDDNFRNDRQIMELRYPKADKRFWKSIDLMKILGFDKLGISLKQTAINLKWHKIQDLPLSPFELVNDSALEMIYEYNLNDTLITKRLYEEIKPLRELRDELSKLYPVDFSSASKSKIANLILEYFYIQELNRDIRDIRNLRTIRDKVFLRECVAKFVSFKSPELKELLDRIKSTYVYRYNKYTYSEKFSFAGCNFVLGIGGLHTNDEAGKFESDTEYLIQDLDVASYYPNLIINNNFYPEHLGEDFIKVLKKITAERLEAKRAGNKVKAETLKITVNSIFGKLGSETFWLLDAKQMLSTTISGQMGLLMLVEALYDAGIQVISCNTDGIVCRISRTLLDKYYEITKEWEKKTNLELEFTPYKKYVRRDVNSYITEKDKGEEKDRLKAKGAFLTKVDLEKSYHMPIVAKALSNYFIYSIPVRETLEQCKDIMQFCVSQKSGSNFGIELHTVEGITKLQKTNRFFITTSGGALMKRNADSGHLTGLYVGNLVTVLNNYNASIPFEDYKVNLSFYEQEVLKIVDAIEPKQISLFDLSTVGNSRFSKMDFVGKPVEEKEIRNIVDELNKLGKNQLVKRIESIVTNNQKIEGISHRYVYVVSIDTKAMMATFYCLATGRYEDIYVSDKAYSKLKLNKGLLVLCRKFSKTESGNFVLDDYSVTDKIEVEKKTLYNS